MFKYLDYLNNNIEGTYRYRLSDSSFTTTFSVAKRDRTSIIKKIMQIYENRGLNVPDAVARYYYWTKNKYVNVAVSIKMTYEDCYLLGIRYTQNYHTCIIYKLRSLDWIFRGRYIT